MGPCARVKGLCGGGEAGGGGGVGQEGKMEVQGGMASHRSFPPPAIVQVHKQSQKVEPEV